MQLALEALYINTMLPNSLQQRRKTLGSKISFYWLLQGIRKSVIILVKLLVVQSLIFYLSKLDLIMSTY